MTGLKLGALYFSPMCFAIFDIEVSHELFLMGCIINSVGSSASCVLVSRITDPVFS